MSELERNLAELLRVSAQRALADELGRTMGGELPASAVVPVLQRSEPAARGTAAWTPPQETKPSKGAEAAPNRPAAKNEAETTTSTVVNALLDGMGLSPILRGLLSLFGGGEEEPAPPLARYLAPASVRLNAGIRKDAASPVGIDYGQGGQAREIGSSTPSVVVNVNAMDTQSFLDRSDDIARAVKRALLESHSLNDVIAEL